MLSSNYDINISSAFPLFALNVSLSQAIEKFGPPKDIELLKAVDIAQAVLYAVTQPRRVAIGEVLVNITELPF